MLEKGQFDFIKVINGKFEGLVGMYTEDGSEGAVVMFGDEGDNFNVVLPYEDLEVLSEEMQSLTLKEVIEKDLYNAFKNEASKQGLKVGYAIECLMRKALLNEMCGIAKSRSLKV